MSVKVCSKGDAKLTPPLRLRFLIIGGGLAGVTSAIALVKKGHDATVLETQTTFSELGAGIQLLPNSTKILNDFGLKDALLPISTSPNEFELRSYSTGEILSRTRIVPDMEERYHAPHLVLHRGDLLALLVAEARRLGAELLTDCKVAEVDFETSTVRTTSGRVFKGDVVVGADGSRSSMRDALLGKNTQARPTGRLVYRTIIPLEAVEANASTKSLIQPPKLTIWMGPGAHVVCYNLVSKGVCNVVLCKSDNSGKTHPTSGPQPACMSDLHTFFEGWDPQLRDLLQLATSAVFWPMLENQYFDRWTKPGTRFILIGDAAHSMPPHLVQGASQCIEDAAYLAELFGRIKHRSQITYALDLFQRLRQPRCSEIARRAEEVGKVWALMDGPTQQERDREMRENGDCEYSNPYCHPNVQQLLYEYDPIRDVNAAWKSRA